MLVRALRGAIARRAFTALPAAAPREAPIRARFTARNTAEVTLADGSVTTVDTTRLRQTDDHAVWMAARAALDATASDFSAAAFDGSPFRSRAALLEEKSSRARGPRVDTPATRFGAVSEPKAIREYARVSGNTVEATGLWTDGDARYGASPDGLVVDGATGERGLLEVKCHFFRRRNRSLPAMRTAPRGYLAQIQGQLAVCGADWCDLACWIPRNSRGPNLRILRVFRDAEYWADIEPRLRAFSADLAAARAALEGPAPPGGHES